MPPVAGDLDVAGVRVGGEERLNRRVGVNADQNNRFASVLGGGYPWQQGQAGGIDVRQRRADRAPAHAGPDLARRAVGDHSAVGDKDHPVGVDVGLLHVMGGEDHRLPAGPGRRAQRPRLMERLRHAAELDGGRSRELRLGRVDLDAPFMDAVGRDRIGEVAA